MSCFVPSSRSGSARRPCPEVKIVPVPPTGGPLHSCLRLRDALAEEKTRKAAERAAKERARRERAGGGTGPVPGATGPPRARHVA